MNKIILMIVLLAKKTIDADCFDLTEQLVTNSKAPKFNVGDRVRITKYKSIFSKSYTNIGETKYL